MLPLRQAMFQQVLASPDMRARLPRASRFPNYGDRQPRNAIMLRMGASRSKVQTAIALGLHERVGANCMFRNLYQVEPSIVEFICSHVPHSTRYPAVPANVYRALDRAFRSIKGQVLDTDRLPDGIHWQAKFSWQEYQKIQHDMQIHVLALAHNMVRNSLLRILQIAHDAGIVDPSSGLNGRDWDVLTTYAVQSVYNDPVISLTITKLAAIYAPLTLDRGNNTAQVVSMTERMLHDFASEFVLGR